MPVRLQGDAAEIRWGYYRAATLGAWTIEQGDIVAVVLEANTWWVSQSPLTFTVGAKLAHRIEGLQITGGTLTARLGPKECAHGVSVRPS